MTPLSDPTECMCLVCDQNMNNVSPSTVKSAPYQTGVPTSRTPVDGTQPLATLPPASATAAFAPPPSPPSEQLEIPAEPALITHNYTDCCVDAQVSDKCLGYCTVHNILDGTTGVEPDACETDFPRIVKCMADGRNHLPCCEKAGVPDICQVCFGL